MKKAFLIVIIIILTVELPVYSQEVIIQPRLEAKVSSPWTDSWGIGPNSELDSYGILENLDATEGTKPQFEIVGKKTRHAKAWWYTGLVMIMVSFVPLGLTMSEANKDNPSNAVDYYNAVSFGLLSAGTVSCFVGLLVNPDRH